MESQIQEHDHDHVHYSELDSNDHHNVKMTELFYDGSETEFPISVKEFRDICAQAIEKNSAVVLRNFAPEIVHPTWDEHLDHLNYQFNNAHNDGLPPIESRNPIRERVVNNVTICGYFYIINRMTQPDYFPSMKPFQKFVAQAVGNGENSPGPAAQFLSFVNNDSIAQIHRDPEHTIYIQNHGEVDWLFYDELTNCTPCASHAFRMKIKRGDVVFVPQGVAHSIDYSGPRAAIIFRATGTNADWSSLPDVETAEIGMQKLPSELAKELQNN